MLGFLKSALAQRTIHRRRDDEPGVHDHFGKLRHAFFAIQRRIDIAVEADPLQVRGACNGAKAEHEAAGYRRGKQRLW